MRTDKKLDRLHSLPLFAACGRAELRELASIVDTVDVAPGYTLIDQGRLHHEGFIVESGTAEVSVAGEVVAEIAEGEMIGEIGLLTGTRATATVTAKTAMTLLVIPRQHFDHVLDETPGLLRAIANELARRLKATDARLH